ncbi:hypothetical protein [Cellulophaga baltica]|uniref:hypothetical protein n=1 Tax=Cellulophaga baltica TaxID=76594 RepID=UPI00249551A6|nr:hypothetical protein [Cellulophaga baltica]
MEILIKYNIINVLGLLFDVIGVIILFYNGNPLVEALKVINGEDGAAEKMIKKGKRSNIALALLIFGFCLQMISNFIFKV